LEDRFKSQALLDEKALLAAMAYVDLNPIRAGLAETSETLDYTSLQERIVGLLKEVASETDSQEITAAKDPDATLDGKTLRPEAETQVLPQAPLMPFDATARTPWAVPFTFGDYLELVDWAGRALRTDKRGYIEARVPKILVRLGIDGERFIGSAERLLKAFGTAVGAPASLTSLCARRQAKYLRGIRTARVMFVAKQAA